MKARGFWTLGDLSDDELVGGLKELISRSSWTEARVVAHLAELEARGLHLRGARSLFDYCQRRLGLSQNEAFYRIQAARIARRFPIVFELLERREIHLTALALVRDYIDVSNHAELLTEVAGKTKEQILCLLAQRSPRPDVKSRIRKLRVQAGAVAAGPSATVEPRSAASYRLQLNMSESLKQKLSLASDLMSHSNPSGDLAVVVERALDLLIDKLRQRRFGQTVRPASPAKRARGKTSAAPPANRANALGVQLADDPRAGDVASISGDSSECDARLSVTNASDPATSETKRAGDARTSQAEESGGEAEKSGGARISEPHGGDGVRCGAGKRRRKHIPHQIRRQLLERDGFGCSFVCDDGRPCGAQGLLQIHHERAFGKGGPDSLQNLRLVCAAHNALLAQEEYGAEHMNAARRRRGRAA